MAVPNGDSWPQNLEDNNGGQLGARLYLHSLNKSRKCLSSRAEACSEGLSPSEAPSIVKCTQIEDDHFGLKTSLKSE